MFFRGNAATCLEGEFSAPQANETASRQRRNVSKRFCIETSTREVIATYRWLVAGDSANDSPIADTKPAFIHDIRACGEMELMAAE